LLSAIAEILAQVFLEVALEAIVATIFRSIHNWLQDANATSPVLATAVYLLLGTGFGVLSIFLFPHALIHRSRFHVSLVVTPVLTGFGNVAGGPRASPEGKDSVQIESFGYGFTLALGVAIIRFFFVS
jgi:hypothetical protein